MMKRRLYFLLVVLISGLAFFPPRTMGYAQGSSANQVIQAINQRRKNRGLHALQRHPILMSIAQQHSDYQASIGYGTHIGPDGSRPKDRALAAGFGGGAAIFISENWAAGANLSIEKAINQYWDDYWHRHTMYNAHAQYIGVGVAYAGSTVYYTVDTGYWVGSPATGSPDDGKNTPAASPQPTAVPIQTHTPAQDGSITHTVQAGQSLWTIAAIYQVPLEELRKRNGFPENHILYPGDEVLIRPPVQATPSPQMTSTPTHLPSPTTSPTSRGTFTVTPPPTSDQRNTPAPTTRPAPSFQPTSKRPLTIAVALIIAAGSVLLSLTKGVSKRNHK